MSLIATIYFSWNLTSWKFSFVGDEWPFYEFAKNIADKNFLVNPLGMNGVYNEHRVLGSLWQSIFIKIFSFSPIFGWRFSDTILIIPINLFYFCWIRRYFKPSTAIISTVLLDCSFYLANFFKIGYLNPIALALFIMSLYYAARAGMTNQTKDFVVLAIILGLSFYVHIGPLFPLIVWAYCLPTIKKNKLKAVQNLAAFIVGYSLIILAGILTSTNEWHVVFTKTIAKKEFSSNWQIIVNILRNFLLFYKNYDYQYNHFVSGPYVDILTRIFVCVGTIVVLLKIKKTKYAFLLLTYLMTNIIIGATSPYSYAPTTRGIFFLPFGFLFAGIALDKIRGFIKWQGVAAILIVILTVNLYRGQIGVFKEVGHHGTSLVIRELQEAKKKKLSRNIVLVMSDLQRFNYHNIYYLQKEYGLSQVFFSVLDANNLTCSKMKRSVILVFERDNKAIGTLKTLPCVDDFTIKQISNYYIY
jgi:hypothetical protein